jgi:hypothetical protein
MQRTAYTKPQKRPLSCKNQIKPKTSKYGTVTLIVAACMLIIDLPKEKGYIPYSLRIKGIKI